MNYKFDLLLVTLINTSPSLAKVTDGDEVPGELDSSLIR